LTDQVARQNFLMILKFIILAVADDPSVMDRVNQAIRDIQLHFDDCVYQHEMLITIHDIFIVVYFLFFIFHIIVMFVVPYLCFIPTFLLPLQRTGTYLVRI
jgi:hypothetical protein